MSPCKFKKIHMYIQKGKGKLFLTLQCQLINVKGKFSY